MKKTVSALLLLGFCACNNHTAEKKENQKSETMTVASLSEEEKKEGWQLLFDGQSTRGWHQYGGGSPAAAWKAEDGTLHFVAAEKKDTSGTDIVTDEEFENFDLKLEWKISVNGNSGIMFYVKESSQFRKPYQTGPEMQVLDNQGHPDAKIPKHRAGDLYDLISCSRETVKPALEWNEVEIKCVNGKLDFWLNGENVVSTQLWDDNWKKMVAASKFSQWPEFGTFHKGRICLQDHGDEVWYRNIRIKRL